jgi:hypothetical protein
MKRISSLLLAGIIFLAACNSDKKSGETTITSDDGKEKVTIDVNQMQQAADAMEKKKEELTKLTPLTTDQLKALLPESLMGGKRTEYNVTSAMGASVGTADYQVNDSVNVTLTVYDCAGSGGAGIYSMQYLAMMNMEQESEEEYTKTVEFKGGKAFEHCEKATNDCTFTFFAGERFLVTLQGDHTGADALKQAAGSLNLK